MVAVRRVSHMGIVVRDLEAAVSLWSQVFGFEPFRRLEIPAEGIRSAFLSPNGSPDEMFIELMEPVDPSDLDNPVARRLAKVGEGFYHVAVEVDDVVGSGKDLAERGLTVLERPPAVEGDAIRWLVHPRSSSGVLVELIQSRAAPR